MTDRPLTNHDFARVMLALRIAIEELAANGHAEAIALIEAALDGRVVEKR